MQPSGGGGGAAAAACWKAASRRIVATVLPNFSDDTTPSCFGNDVLTFPLFGIDRMFAGLDAIRLFQESGCVWHDGCRVQFILSDAQQQDEEVRDCLCVFWTKQLRLANVIPVASISSRSSNGAGNRDTLFGGGKRAYIETDDRSSVAKTIAFSDTTADKRVFAGVVCGRHTQINRAQPVAQFVAMALTMKMYTYKEHKGRKGTQDRQDVAAVMGSLLSELSDEVTKARMELANTNVFRKSQLMKWTSAGWGLVLESATRWLIFTTPDIVAYVFSGKSGRLVGKHDAHHRARLGPRGGSPAAATATAAAAALQGGALDRESKSPYAWDYPKVADQYPTFVLLMSRYIDAQSTIISAIEARFADELRDWEEMQHYLRTLDLVDDNQGTFVMLVFYNNWDEVGHNTLVSREPEEPEDLAEEPPTTTTTTTTTKTAAVARAILPQLQPARNIEFKTSFYFSSLMEASAFETYVLPEDSMQFLQQCARKLSVFSVAGKVEYYGDITQFASSSKRKRDRMTNISVRVGDAASCNHVDEASQSMRPGLEWHSHPINGTLPSSADIVVEIHMCFRHQDHIGSIVLTPVGMWFYITGRVTRQFITSLDTQGFRTWQQGAVGRVEDGMRALRPTFALSSPLTRRDTIETTRAKLQKPSAQSIAEVRAKVYAASGVLMYFIPYPTAIGSLF